LLDQRLRIHFCCWIKDWGYISVVGSKIEDTFLLLDQRLRTHFFSAFSVNVDDVFVFLCLFGDWMK